MSQSGLDNGVPDARDVGPRVVDDEDRGVLCAHGPQTRGVLNSFRGKKKHSSFVSKTMARITFAENNFALTKHQRVPYRAVVKILRSGSVKVRDLRGFFGAEDLSIESIVDLAEEILQDRGEGWRCILKDDGTLRLRCYTFRSYRIEERAHDPISTIIDLKHFTSEQVYGTSDTQAYLKALDRVNARNEEEGCERFMAVPPGYKLVKE